MSDKKPKSIPVITPAERKGVKPWRREYVKDNEGKWVRKDA